jgi:hypothetical protein
MATRGGSATHSEGVAQRGRLHVRLLGGFAVAIDDAELPVPVGRPSTLLQLLALSGGAITISAAAEALWPDADDATARRRLRNVLGRLRTAGALVERHGAQLRLPRETVIDAVEFERAARRALQSRTVDFDVAAGNDALALYRGDLLPGECADEIELHRERLQALVVDLSDRVRSNGSEPHAAMPSMLLPVDYQAALDLLAEIHDAQDLPELRRRAIDGLRELVTAEWSSLNEMDAQGRPVAWLVDPELPADSLPTWERLGHTNPLLQRYLRTHDGRPYRFSDVLAPTQLEHLPLYREFYLPLGIRHQIAFTLPAPRDVTVAIALSRADPDFTDRERARLDLVRPHIIQAYRNVGRWDARGTHGS